MFGSFALFWAALFTSSYGIRDHFFDRFWAIFESGGLVGYRLSAKSPPAKKKGWEIFVFLNLIILIFKFSHGILIIYSLKFPIEIRLNSRKSSGRKSLTRRSDSSRNSQMEADAESGAPAGAGDSPPARTSHSQEHDQVGFIDT